MTGLAEIREADAPADTAAIYSQIKQASGLPLVNLIWRHFAALPGVLPGPGLRSSRSSDRPPWRRRAGGLRQG